MTKFSKIDLIVFNVFTDKKTAQFNCLDVFYNLDVMYNISISYDNVYASIRRLHYFGFIYISDIKENVKYYTVSTDGLMYVTDHKKNNWLKLLWKI